MGASLLALAKSIYYTIDRAYNLLAKVNYSLRRSEK